MNNIDVGLMIDGQIVYSDNITDGVLSISDGGQVDAGKSNSGQFTVTAVGGGVSTIYVRNHSEAQRIGTGVSDKYFVKELQVSVYQPAASIVIDQGSALEVETDDEYMFGIIGTNTYNGSVQLSATVGPEDATDKSISWSSDNSAVKVDANGLVSISRQKLPVTANITATSNDNPAVSATIAVTFKKAVVHVTGVTLNTSEVTLAGVGSTAKLTASVAPSDAENKNVSWSTSDPNVVAVAADGTLTAVGIGDATVTVTTEEGSYTAACTVKVRADKTALQAVIDRAQKLDTSSVEDAQLVAAFEAALDTANQINAEDMASQERVDAAAKALEEAITALNVYAPLTDVTVVPVSASDEKEGVVVYHKTPWYKTWTSQTVELTVQVNEGAEIASVEWRLANWSVDKPEGKIESVSGNNATIRPTFGVGPRSIWVEAVVTDVYGNTTVSDPVKVRFINWDWQK